MKNEQRKGSSIGLESAAPIGMSSFTASDAAFRPGACFQTTHWSVILEAGRENSAARGEALEELCLTSWAPVYAFIRRSGRGIEDAQDLTQSFFAQLLERNALHNLDPRKGKFRSFLLVVLRHFLVNEARREGAAKRGGGKALFPLEAGLAEDRFLLRSDGRLSPEQLFDRNWAVAVMDHAFGTLRSELEQERLDTRFECLKVFLWSDGHSEEYAKAGAILGLTAPAVKVAVHRLRHRYSELLRQEVARTVESPFEVDAEMRYLLDLLMS